MIPLLDPSILSPAFVWQLLVKATPRVMGHLFPKEVLDHRFSPWTKNGSLQRQILESVIQLLDDFTPPKDPCEPLPHVYSDFLNKHASDQRGPSGLSSTWSTRSIRDFGGGGSSYCGALLLERA